jgi:hypothetical protein
LDISQIGIANGLNGVITERVDEIRFTETSKGRFVGGCNGLDICCWNDNIFAVTSMRGYVDRAKTDDCTTDSQENENDTKGAQASEETTAET